MWGMNRAGVTPGTAAVALAGKVHEQDGLRLAGLMAWEGHTLSVADADERAEAIKHSIGQLADSVEACRTSGLPVEIVSCGGSGTMNVTMQQPQVTEIQAGGAIFGDATYQMWGVPTDPALFGQVVVTSRPAPDRIVTDAGFKTLPGAERQPLPVALENVGQHLALGGAWGDHAVGAERECRGGRRAGFHRRLRRRDGLPARCAVRGAQGRCGDGVVDQRAGKLR